MAVASSSEICGTSLLLAAAVLFAKNAATLGKIVNCHV
jgi:hypothetical protein